MFNIKISNGSSGHEASDRQNIRCRLQQTLLVQFFYVIQGGNSSYRKISRSFFGKRAPNLVHFYILMWIFFFFVQLRKYINFVWKIFQNFCIPKFRFLYACETKQITQPTKNRAFSFRKLNSTFFHRLLAANYDSVLSFFPASQVSERVLNKSSKSTENALIKWLQKETTKYFL
jgi:hypothetical protein